MIIGIRPITDHGGLTGLSDDDHTLYFKADGSRNLTGALVTSGIGIRPAVNSTTAIQIQQSSGAALVNCDMINFRVGVNETAPTYTLSVKNTSSGVDGILLDKTKSTAFAGVNIAETGSVKSYFGQGGSTSSYVGGANVFQIWNLTSTGNIVIGSGGSSSSNERMRITYDGNIGIATTTPTSILAFGGNSARTIWLERHTTDATPGNDLSIYAGGCKASQNNQPGGSLNLGGGLSTGDKESGVKIYGYVAGASGSADCSTSLVFQVLGNKAGFFSGTPAAQQTLAAYTSDAESVAYTGIDNTQAGAVYATVADLNTLRVAYDNLRASYDDLRTKLLATTLVLSA